MTAAEDVEVIFLVDGLILLGVGPTTIRLCRVPHCIPGSYALATAPKCTKVVIGVLVIARSSGWVGFVGIKHLQIPYLSM